MKHRTDFAALILTHGRSNSVITYNTLRRQGYTGRIVLMVDDEDSQIDAYRKKFGDEVVVFSKQAAIDITDSGDNFGKRNSVVYARNYTFTVAKELGLKYFLELDDDYTQFRYTFDNDRNYITRNIEIKSLDGVIEAMLDFFIESGATTIAMSQGGDFIGGEKSTFSKLERRGKFSRKVMNSFFCDVDKPFKFMGRINEDVNLYAENGRRGELFITVPRIRLEQKQTQANDGGLTDIYLDLGTYVKSFYSVMYAPSCVKIAEMGVTARRLHHRLSWKNTCPLIIPEEYKKHG
tara:strand:+ start:1876 stop:2751 length:876 start_codon:yes stop_codon:yes gene_type:complete